MGIAATMTEEQLAEYGIKVEFIRFQQPDGTLGEPMKFYRFRERDGLFDCHNRHCLLLTLR